MDKRICMRDFLKEMKELGISEEEIENKQYIDPYQYTQIFEICSLRKYGNSRYSNTSLPQNKVNNHYDA